jgi:hypothetical protein
MRNKKVAAVMPELLEDNDVLNCDPQSEEMETVIVSPRGVFYLPHPTEKRVTRLGEDGKPLYAPKTLLCRPGCAITLPVSEVKRFIEMGRVHRPGEETRAPPHPDAIVPQDIGSPDGPTQNRGGVFELDESGKPRTG